VLAEAVEQQEAADAADTLEHLEDDEAIEVLVAMEESAAAEALAEMEDPLAAGVIDDLLEEGRSAYAGRLLSLMAPDDAADLLQSVDAAQREALLLAVPAPTAANLRRLLGYDEESAGGLMTTDYVAVGDTMTVGQATEAIRAGSLPEQLNHVPVVDAQGRLTGVVGLRNLLLSPAGERVEDLMDRAPRAIRTDLDQERVAREFDRYDYFMLPVVDDANRVLGIVTVDDVIDIIREEQTEDVQKTVGAGAEEAVYSPVSEKIRGRFPWMATSLLMTLAAAVIVLFFEDLIREQPVVAFLMPVIAALVGNAGHQALAVTLRGIVLDQVRPERVRPLILREAAVGLITGSALAVMMFLLIGILSTFISGVSWEVGAMAAVALPVSMTAGTLAGSSIPLIMRRLGADPAQSSAIFLIMITDGISFATFLGIAHLAYQWLMGAANGV